jgi:hypothetical protein
MMAVSDCAYTRCLSALRLPFLHLYLFKIALAVEVSSITHFYAAVSLPLALCHSKR